MRRDMMLDHRHRARKTLDPFSYQPAPVRRQDRPSKPDGLTKQTYSIQVHSSSYESPKKWHIVAYFSVRMTSGNRIGQRLTSNQGDDYTRLPVVDNYEYLRNIRIPDGVYFAKGNPTRQTRVMNAGEDREYSVEAYPDQPGWTTPSWPQSASDRHHDAVTPSRHTSTSSSSSAAVYAQQQATASPRLEPADARYSLPRLSTVAPPHHLTGQPRPACTPGSPYSPLTPEDRKALNSFRVVL
jgi:Gti1/Pac2 family transcription factor